MSIYYFFKQNENAESNFRMSEFVKQSTNINSGVDKVDWIADVSYSNRFTIKVKLSFTPNAQLSSLSKNLSYLEKVGLNGGYKT